VKEPTPHQLDALWAGHATKWRDPAQIVSHWEDATAPDRRLLEERARGPWWELLGELGVTLLVTREYEHLVMAHSMVESRPRSSFLPLPHPSGLVADRDRGEVHIASTRNPNQVLTLRPVRDSQPREDIPARADGARRRSIERTRPLLPARLAFHPGFLYMHDLALIGGRLHANSVGQNAVVRLDDSGRHDVVWWPKSIETSAGRGTAPVPRLGRNYLQLNSIAAGATLKQSFFSASCAAPGPLLPGQLRFEVDGKGVIFSGATRQPICVGLTRPHSARLHEGRVWVANSGYGEAGFVEDGRFRPVVRLPGWTRGLCFVKGFLFVATSRVIPRFAHYAPGLKASDCVCAIHAVDLASGVAIASLTWPYANQVFAIDWMSAQATSGFPFESRRRAEKTEKLVFYAYKTPAKSQETLSR
jgi:uncharacterized protein (TIGR03032 family)